MWLGKTEVEKTIRPEHRPRTWVAQKSTRCASRWFERRGKPEFPERQHPYVVGLVRESNQFETNDATSAGVATLSQL